MSKIAVITGASGGIGRAISHKLCAAYPARSVQVASCDVSQSGQVTALLEGLQAAGLLFGAACLLPEADDGVRRQASLASEVAFFAFGRPLVRRFGPVNVIILGGVAAALRWVGIGSTSDAMVLVAAQCLHALAFGAFHMAAIRIIAEKVDSSLSATGQGLYSAVIMGLGMGIFVMLSGQLYTAFGAGSFYLMSFASMA